jgi:hypothetical protein
MLLASRSFEENPHFGTMCGLSAEFWQKKRAGLDEKIDWE